MSSPAAVVTTTTQPDESDQHEGDHNDDNNDGHVHVKYDIGFKSGFFSRQPVHEHMTIASLIHSKIPFRKDTTYATLDDAQWEYIRGLIWNDDPSCLLFVDDAASNHKWGWGLEWLRAYENGSVNSMTRRSHWGDMQFLHSMASADGEDPYTTRKNILDWFEVIYKIAIGQGERGEKLKHAFPLLFNDSTIPNADATLTDLLIATTPKFEDYDLRKRALGSCIHMIQDSFAMGHTQRRLLNSYDLVDRDGAGYLQFRPGTYGLWGPIMCFHNYGSQDKTRHTHYDGLEGEVPDPQDLDSFNGIVGARNAIVFCTRLLDFAAAGTKWEDGVLRFMREEVFGLDVRVRPSDGQVDPEMGIPPVVRNADCGDEEKAAMIDSYEKMPLLESGWAAKVDVTTIPDRPNRDRWRLSVGQMRVFMIVVILLYGYQLWIDAE